MAEAALTPGPNLRDHIVDVLIAERAPKLSGGPAWPVLRPALYALLGYDRARAMADAIAPLGGQAALDYIAALLEVQIETVGLERLPREGKAVLVCNHPTGIADGIAVYEALRRVRSDIVFFSCPGAGPVNGRTRTFPPASRSKSNLDSWC